MAGPTWSTCPEEHSPGSARGWRSGAASRPAARATCPAEGDLPRLRPARAAASPPPLDPATDPLGVGPGPADEEQDREVDGAGAGRGQVAELLADLVADLERRDDDADEPGLEEGLLGGEIRPDRAGEGGIAGRAADDDDVRPRDDRRATLEAGRQVRLVEGLPTWQRAVAVGDRPVQLGSGSGAVVAADDVERA